MKKVNVLLLALILGISTQLNSSTDIKENSLSSSVNEAVKVENKEQEKEQPISENSIVAETKVEEQAPASTVYISPLQEIKTRNDNLGTVGRLYIPTINLNVGVNYANFYTNQNYDAQAIVDRADSAAYFQFGSKTTIADHSYQGFNRIINLSSGAEAYLKRQDETIEIFRLNNKFTGRNISEDLIDTTGNSVQNMSGNLIIYTCYGTGDGVMITLWDKIA